jgi:hypothetical protein
VNPYANFVGTMEDLQRCGNSNDQYELMRIPSLLRLLLLEGLVDQVNREFRCKIQYVAGGVLEPARSPSGDIVASELAFGSVGDSFDPHHLYGVKVHASYTPPTPRTVSKDGLLKLHVMVAGGHYFTVHELIQNLGYVQGLIHPGAPATEKETQLLAWRQLLQLQGVGAGLSEIRSVARVVHRALTPLRDEVLAKYRPERSGT